MIFVRYLFITPIVLAIIAAGALQWYEQINLDKILVGKAPSELVYRLPFIDKPQTLMAYRWLQGGSLVGHLEDEFVEEQIERALIARPLYPDNWLMAARVKHKLGKTSEATEMAEHALALGRTRGYLLWDLAMFWLAFPDQDKAITLLHDYLLARPYDVQKVLFLAYRFKQDKAALLESLVPYRPDPGYELDSDFYVARVLQTGTRIKNVELAGLAWKRFESRDLHDNTNAPVIKSYLDFLIQQGDKQTAFAVWRDMHPGKQLEAGVTNAGFEDELSGYGFGWRSNAIKGVEFERSSDEAVEGNYSFKVSMDGSENVNLYRPSITLPVEGGKSYLLSVYWKGEQVSTRSNPFFEILYQQDAKTKAVRSEPKRKTWDWQRVEMSFEVPEETGFVELRLRRWKTEALDKLISGTVYIDDVQLIESG